MLADTKEMNEIVISNWASRAVDEITQGGKPPSVSSLFTLALVVETIVLSEKVHTEDTGFSIDLDSHMTTHQLDESCPDGPRIHQKVSINGIVYDRNELIGKLTTVWEQSLGKFLLSDTPQQIKDDALYRWVRDYYFDAAGGGYGVVPHACLFSAHVATLIIRSNSIDVARKLLREIESTQESVIGKVNRIIHPHLLRIPLPYVFRIVLSNVDSPEQIIPFAFRLRDERVVKRFRRWCSNLDETIEKDGSLRDSDYVEIARHLGEAVGRDLDFKPDLLNVIGSYTWSVASTGLELMGTLKLTALAKSLVGYLLKRSRGRNTAFLYEVPDRLRTARDVRSLVQKVWGYSMSDAEVYEYSELCSLSTAITATGPITSFKK